MGEGREGLLLEGAQRALRAESALWGLTHCLPIPLEVGGIITPLCREQTKAPGKQVAQGRTV